MHLFQPFIHSWMESTDAAMILRFAQYLSYSLWDTVFSEDHKLPCIDTPQHGLTVKQNFHAAVQDPSSIYCTALQCNTVQYGTSRKIYRVNLSPALPIAI